MHPWIRLVAWAQGFTSRSEVITKKSRSQYQICLTITSRHDKLSLHKSRKNHGKITEKSLRNHCHDIKFGGKSRSLSRPDIKFMAEEKP